MKKLLIACLLLLMLPLMGSSQMRIESHKQELFKGVKLNYKVYYSPVPTNNWILFLHGAGECGPADGSALNDVETHGLAKYAKTNTYRNFNILAPQATCSGTISNWSVIRPVLLDLVKEHYHAQKIIVTGLSQGGMEAVDWGFRDKKGYVDGIAVMCGKTSSKKGDIPRDTVIVNGVKIAVIAWRLYRNVPYLGIHGDKDTDVSFYDGKKVYTGIIAATGRTAPATFLTIPGGNHSSAWTKGYSSSDPFGVKFFAFVDEIFKASPVIECQAVVDTLNRTATFFLPGGLEYKAVIIKQ